MSRNYEFVCLFPFRLCMTLFIDTHASFWILYNYQVFLQVLCFCFLFGFSSMENNPQFVLTTLHERLSLSTRLYVGVLAIHLERAKANIPVPLCMENQMKFIAMLKIDYTHIAKNLHNMIVVWLFIHFFLSFFFFFFFFFGGGGGGGS